jgi:hypothetical protein
MMDKKQQANAVERHLGVTRIDKRSKYEFLPEAPNQKSTLKLGDTSLSVENHTNAIPFRDVWEDWFRARTEELAGIAASGVGVFDPEHEHYDWFQIQVMLIRGRYVYIDATIYYFANIRIQTWEVTWRYLCKLVGEVFSKFKLGHKIPLDQKILEFMRNSTGGAVLGSQAVKMLIEETLTQSRLDAAIAETPALPSANLQGGEPRNPRDKPPRDKPPTQPNPGGPQPPQGPPNQKDLRRQGRRCPLCNSAEHDYSAGNFNHPKHVPITQVCSARNPNDAADTCGLKHARGGPLASPCRWALAGAGPAVAAVPP